MELLRLQFENEELESLKSELEWRKRSERKEIKQLGEEMATMQTLYQYRSVSPIYLIKHRVYLIIIHKGGPMDKIKGVNSIKL